jgi:2-oxoglutarate ferredoxin oxidoreductase subunit beta
MTTTIETNGVEVQKFTAKDYQTDQDVRWCPGCGDYSVLAQVQRSLPNFGESPDSIAFIAGIGCSSRFPYYMDTYGFHGIHGRASVIAAGLKMARPDIDVWVATGDGDSLSIGGNHFIHTLRRNTNLNIIMFNNRIYGLTKGQYSPTSEHGKKTKSTPFGSIDHPFNPVLLALGAEGTFIARSMDRDAKHMQAMIHRAHEHKGTSFVEIFQNCNIFNDGAFEAFTEKDTKDENCVFLEHGKPLVFAKGTKALRLDGFRPEVISLTDGKWSINDALVYDETSRELAYIVARLSDYSDFPTAFGVFHSEERPTYDDEMTAQIDWAKEKFGAGDLKKFLQSGNTWVVS